MLIFLARWFGFKNEILPLWSFFFGGGAGGAGIEEGNEEGEK